tara:strand:- start:29 stop:307 length:279 start_codon:yes stop_codon:yes gene_type:complete
MVSVAVFASVVAPLCIITFILLILVIGSRSSISTLREDFKDLKAKQRLHTTQISDIYDQVETIGVWAWAAQEVGFLPVPQNELDRVWDEVMG